MGVLKLVTLTHSKVEAQPSLTLAGKQTYLLEDTFCMQRRLEGIKLDMTSEEEDNEDEDEDGPQQG